MAYRPNTLQTAGAGAVGSFSFAGKVRKKFLALGLLLSIVYPTTVVNAANTVPTPTEAQILDAAYGSMSIRYGTDGSHVIFATIKGSEFRTIHRFLQRQSLQSTIPIVATTASGAVNCTIDLYIPFTAQALKDSHDRGVGWTQLDSFTIDVTEGTALNVVNGGSSVVRAAGNVLTTINVIGYRSNVDQWTPVLTYKKFVSNGLALDGGDGLHVGAWDENAAQANTLITLVSVGDEEGELHTVIPPATIADEYDDDYLAPAAGAGAADVTDTVTMMYSIKDQMDSSKALAGRLKVVQAQQYVTQLKVDDIYYPVMSADEANEAAVAKARAEGTSILAQVHESAHSTTGESLHHAKTRPIRFYGPTHPEFTLRAGLLAHPGEPNATISIPAHVAAQHAAAVAIAGESGGATQVAAQAKSLEQLARQIPGMAAHAANGDASSSQGTVAHLSRGFLARGTPQTHGFLRTFLEKLHIIG